MADCFLFHRFFSVISLIFTFGAWNFVVFFRCGWFSAVVFDGQFAQHRPERKDGGLANTGNGNENHEMKNNNNNEGSTDRDFVRLFVWKLPTHDEWNVEIVHEKSSEVTVHGDLSAMEPGCSFHPCVSNCLFRSKKFEWFFLRGGGITFQRWLFLTFKIYQRILGDVGLLMEKKVEKDLNEQWKEPGSWQINTYTSGHDYLDAERASCLMNAHWNTVWSNRPSSISNSPFPGLGFKSQSRQLFTMWLQWQLISINQSIKLFKQIFSIDWSLQKVGRRKKTEKNALTGDSNPRPGNVEFEMELELPQCANRAL